MHPVSTSIPHNSGNGIGQGGESQTGAPLPCLNSNISIIDTPLEHAATRAASGFLPLSTQHKKSSFQLSRAVSNMAEAHGLEKVGFLTLTFKDHVLDSREAQRRFNSLLTNVIKPRYRDFVRVFERQKSGRIHYHLLVAMPFDIRTGADFERFSQGDYGSASSSLRSEWAFWRKTAKAYGFGRTELLPIRSTSEAISKYVGKYISKHIESREEEDKGVRLWACSSSVRGGTTRFSFNSRGSHIWRYKLSLFASIVSERYNRPIDYEDLRLILGPKWAYHHRDFIVSLPEPPI